MKGSPPKQLTGAQSYLDIAMSGYHFRGYSDGMDSNDITIFLFRYKSLHNFSL